MKLNVGDKVVPSFMLGRIVEVTDTKIVIEIKDTKTGGFRYTELTEEHAALRGTSFEDLINESLVRVHEQD